MIKVPDWLKMTARAARIRAANGLTPKRDGWYKSLGGKTRYICKPCPVEEAVAVLGAKVKDMAGIPRSVVINPTRMTLEQLVELFLAAMLERHRTGVPKKLGRRTYDDLVRVLDRFAEAVGPARLVVQLGPDDFSRFAKTFAGKALTTRRREIQYVDMMFNWAGPGTKRKNLIPFVVRGPDWVKPSDNDILTAGDDADKAYEAPELVAAFKAVKGNPLLAAAAHLGLNCAMNPMDMGTLPESFVNLDGAEIRFPRGKTGVARLCPLLPETVTALRGYLAFRAKFKSVRPESAGLFFRTREGMPYARTFAGNGQDAGYSDNLLSRRWSVAVGLPLSGLRSTFATVADDWHDQRAVDIVMGHKVGNVGRHIRRHYAKKFSPARARRLVEHVWRLAFDAGAQADRLHDRGEAEERSLAPVALPAGSRATAHKPRG